MPRDTRTPPLITDGVFAASGSVVINASRDEVWKVLLDFESYPEWNPFVRSQKITDSSGNAHPSGPSIAEGKHTSISVHLPPSLSSSPPLLGLGKSGSFCEITVLDEENYRVAWETVPSLLRPGWALHAERWQMLSAVKGEDGQERTKYETVEVMWGPMAYAVKWVVGAWLKMGFKAFADGLKERVEANRANASRPST